MLRKLFTSAFFIAFFAVLLIPSSAFAETNSSQNDKERFFITDTTTLGDIIQYTNPEEYAKMPTEIKERFNLTYALESLDDSNGNDEVALAGLPVIWGNMAVATSDVTSSSFAYTGTFTLTAECPYIYMEAIVYDHNTNEMITSKSSTSWATAVGVVSGVATNLTSNYPYRVYVFGDALPPTGYEGTGIMTTAEVVYTKR